MMMNITKNMMKMNHMMVLQQSGIDFKKSKKVRQ